jgi:excinuclease UvrABC ATPase subunit
MTEFITIRGVRENNLHDVSLQIPKRKLTIFTGVSGSGKSSIVYDTIATEAQRQLYEYFSLFVRNFLPKYPQPDADAIENLNMAVIVDQRRLGGGSHSTVGTATDIYGVLRLLFSRAGNRRRAERLIIPSMMPGLWPGFRTRTLFLSEYRVRQSSRR